MKSNNAQKCADYRIRKKNIAFYTLEVPTTAGLLRVERPAIVIDSDAKVQDMASNLIIRVERQGNRIASQRATIIDFMVGR
jgi:hypothetical protein